MYFIDLSFRSRSIHHIQQPQNLCPTCRYSIRKYAVFVIGLVQCHSFRPHASQSVTRQRAFSTDEIGTPSNCLQCAENQ